MADEPTQKPPQDPSQGKPEEKSAPEKKPAPASSSGEGKSGGADKPEEKPAAKPEGGKEPPKEKPAAAEKPAEKGKEAAKPAAEKPAAAAEKPAAPAKPAPPKKEEVKPEPLDNEMVQRFRKRFGEAIREATLDRKQAIVLVDAGRLAEVAEYAREEEQFDMLSDLTATDWPKREKRFEVVLNLYSFPRNERLRIKCQVAEGEPCPSVTGVWGAANWLERECFDMFGIQFAGHPDLRRILLPEEWQGYPLRKDYDILTQDTAWVRENLGIESGQ